MSCHRRWAMLAGLLWMAVPLTSAAVDSPVQPTVAPAILLAGRAAPPPSPSWCGLSLVADASGPQILVSCQPATATVALEPGEEASFVWTIAPTGAAECSIEAEAVGGKAVVRLSLGEGAAVADVAADGRVQSLRLSKTSAGPASLRLTVTAGTAAAVAIRRVELGVGGKPVAIGFLTEPVAAKCFPPPALPALRPAIESALVEWDWRMQDGIQTPLRPAPHREAVQTLRARGAALLEQWPPATRPQGLAAAWRALDAEAERTAASDDAAWQSLWRRMHALRRELLLAHPLAPRGPIAFVKQVPSLFSHQLTQYYGMCARPGGGVFVLVEPGRSMQARALTESLPRGSFQHLDSSYDGRRLLFSYCRAFDAPAGRDTNTDRHYHLYEADVDRGAVRPLTDGPFDDFAPRWLPDGGAIFISTRRGGFHRCGRGPCPVYTLCLWQAGSPPRTISYHETHEWDPCVLADGRVIYTRWDYVDRNAVFYQQLWTVRPDGTDARIFYGNQTLNPVGVWEARQVPGSHRVMATAAAHHAMTAGSIILVDPRRGVDGPGPIVRLTPDALFPESETPLASVESRVWNARAGVSGAIAEPVEGQRWPGHCYRTPHPLSERLFLAAYSYDRLIGEPAANPANMFGLYLVDAAGNKELLYRDLAIGSLWPTPLGPHPRPPVVPSALRTAAAESGIFVLADVQSGWKSPAPIKRLRIVQVLPKTTPHIDMPTVGLAGAAPGKQVLGTVPVEADGSAAFVAPAGVPLSFQALDDQGRAVQIMRSIAYLQPGETSGCVGCHEPRDRAATTTNLMALRRPPSIIAPGPDGSRPLSYPRLVQPVLDRHCVTCHNAGQKDGGVALTGQPQGRYTVSYNALAPLVSYSAWAGKKGDFRKVNSEPVTAPGFFGARGSKLSAIAFGDHHGVRLTPDDVERLVTWMDANALFYGTFDPTDQARQLRGEQIAGPALE